MARSGIPQHRQLYELLRRHIIEGVYREGDLLPSENELCATYNLTRPTVRHALDTLVHEGYIKKQQGKGSIVSALPQGVGILSVAGTTSALGGRNLETRILQKPVIRPWPGSFMFTLSQTEKESGCIYMERLRLVDGKPVFFDINYLPNINLPRFTGRSFENRSLFDILRRHYGIEVRGGEQKLRAIGAAEQTAALLNLPEGAPVLFLERKFDTSRPDYYFYSAITCKTDELSVYGTF